MTISANFPNVQPSLLLDFANAKQLPPSVNFTRATTATYYDGSTTAMAEQNLLLQSQAFDNASWTGSATVTANSDTAPDGTTTADTLNPTGGSNLSKAQQASTSTTGTYTASIYARVASGTGKVYLSLLDGAWGAASTITTCNLTTTWTRFTVSRTLTAGNTWFVVIGQTDGSTDATTCIIWGAQLEQRSTATAYTATTTQAVTNYIPVLLTAGGGQPRFDHNPTTSESLGLLIEEQRTNLSPAVSNGWGSGGTLAALANANLAPDGTMTATWLYNTGTSNPVWYVSNGLTAGTYTLSCYVKSGYFSVSSFQLRIDYSGGSKTASFNTATGAVTGADIGVTTTSTDVGNGWWRFSMTSTYPANLINTVLTISTTSAYATASVWGVQLEAGSFPTSYIFTTSAAATRAADVVSMSGANFTSWFNAGEGTFYGEANLSGGGRYFHTVKTGSSAQIEGVQQTGTFDAFVYATTVEANIQIAAASFINRRVALAYQVNDIAACVSGGTVSVDTNAILPLDLNAFYVNSYGTSGPLGSGTVKKVAYYPQRLTDAQLQALTS